MRESQVEKKTVEIAESKGFVVRKVKWLGRNGAPDRLFGHEDYCPLPTLIEFKRPGVKEARLQQDLEHERLRRIGFRVAVCDNVREALAFLGCPHV